MYTMVPTTTGHSYLPIVAPEFRRIITLSDKAVVFCDPATNSFQSSPGTTPVNYCEFLQLVQPSQIQTIDATSIDVFPNRIAQPSLNSNSTISTPVNTTDGPKLGRPNKAKRKSSKPTKPKPVKHAPKKDFSEDFETIENIRQSDIFAFRESTKSCSNLPDCNSLFDDPLKRAENYEIAGLCLSILNMEDSICQTPSTSKACSLDFQCFKRVQKWKDSVVIGTATRESSWHGAIQPQSCLYLDLVKSLWCVECLNFFESLRRRNLRGFGERNFHRFINADQYEELHGLCRFADFRKLSSLDTGPPLSQGKSQVKSTGWQCSRGLQPEELFPWVGIGLHHVPDQAGVFDSGFPAGCEEYVQEPDLKSGLSSYGDHFHVELEPDDIVVGDETGDLILGNCESVTCGVDDDHCRGPTPRIDVNLQSEGEDTEDELEVVPGGSSRNSDNLFLRLDHPRKRAAYALQNVGGLFNQIVEYEKCSLELFRALGCTDQVAWQHTRLYQSRVCCDKCHKSIFNLHLFCADCGLALCASCVAFCIYDLVPRNSQRGARAKRRRLKKTPPSSSKKGQNDSMLILEDHDVHEHLIHLRKDEYNVAACPRDLRHGHYWLMAGCFPKLGTDPLGILNEMQVWKSQVQSKFNIPESCICDRKPERTSEQGWKVPCFCEAPSLEVENVGDASESGRIMRLFSDATNNTSNLAVFQQAWSTKIPILFENCHSSWVSETFNPEIFQNAFKDEKSTICQTQECRHGFIIEELHLHTFWDSFINDCSTVGNDGEKLILKLKDFPPGKRFCDVPDLAVQHAVFCRSLPVPLYTHPETGAWNLANHLAARCSLKPDLGPKMYAAYGMTSLPANLTTCLHVDASDAVNICVYVKEEPHTEGKVKAIVEMVAAAQCDETSMRRVEANPFQAGAIWQIVPPKFYEKLREFLTKNISNIPKMPSVESTEIDDPIHDQILNVTPEMFKKFKNEGGVVYSFVQMLGDAVVIPAGAAHQVQNLNCAIKLACDFISPEGVDQCAKLSREFRLLSSKHLNYEDKIQIERVVFHTVKNAIWTLLKND